MLGAMLIPRSAYLKQISSLLGRYPVVCLLGARQVGKTTLAREYVRKNQPGAQLLDLESPEDLARLTEPLAELKRYQGLIVLDEIQRRPELFPVLRVLCDERPRRRKFLLLGSAAPHLLRQSSETLAGRIAYMEVGPLSMVELDANRWERLWLRGGFPESFLSKSDTASFDWRRRFRQTFIERDLPALELPFTPASATLGRFWSMLAHVHGNLLNWSELGRSIGATDATARRYVDLLEGALMVRQLKPWYENISKRQVKAPKVYFRDSGLLHVDLGVGTEGALLSHPSLGASWEGFLLEQLSRGAGLEAEETFFWRTQHGAELDLLVVRSGRRHGFEFKRSSAPTLTQSMRQAFVDLKLDSLTVIHSGTHSFGLAKSVLAEPWTELPSIARRLSRGR